MNLTARERLLMSLTSKQVEELIDNPPKGNVNINGLIELDHNDILDLYMTLQQRDQRVINENKSAITKGYEIERTKD